jgi:hypothetical protein
MSWRAAFALGALTLGLHCSTLLVEFADAPRAPPRAELKVAPRCLHRWPLRPAAPATPPRLRRLGAGE